MDADIAIASEVARLEYFTDGVGHGIDPGIIETVALLRLLGFRTSGSCEGHPDWGLATPWIDLEKPRPDALDRGVDAWIAAVDRGDREASQAAAAEVDGQRLAPNALHAERRGRLEALLADFYRDRGTPPAGRLEAVESGSGARLCVAAGDCQVAEGRMLAPSEYLDDVPAFLAASQGEMRDFTSFLRLCLVRELARERHPEPFPHESALLVVARSPVLSDIEAAVQGRPAVAPAAQPELGL